MLTGVLVIVGVSPKRMVSLRGIKTDGVLTNFVDRVFVRRGWFP